MQPRSEFVAPELPSLEQDKSHVTVVVDGDDKHASASASSVVPILLGRAGQQAPAAGETGQVDALQVHIAAHIVIYFCSMSCSAMTLPLTRAPIFQEIQRLGEEAYA